MSVPTKEQIKMAADGIDRIDNAVRELDYIVDSLVAIGNVRGSDECTAVGQSFIDLADSLDNLHHLLCREAGRK
jgi:hypothetical protein